MQWPCLEATSLVFGWHALSRTRRACKSSAACTPFEDSGRATQPEDFSCDKPLGLRSARNPWCFLPCRKRWVLENLRAVTSLFTQEWERRKPMPGMRLVHFWSAGKNATAPRSLREGREATGEGRGEDAVRELKTETGNGPGPPLRYPCRPCPVRMRQVSDRRHRRWPHCQGWTRSRRCPPCP
jgi:hypothetical protein